MPMDKPPALPSIALRRAMATFVALMAVVTLAAIWVGGHFLYGMHRDEPVASALIIVAVLLLFVALLGVTGLRLVRGAAMAQTEAAISEDRLRSLTDHALDIVAIVGRDHRVIYVNRAVESVLGRLARDYIGRDLAEWMHPDDQTRGVAALRQAAEDASRPHGVEVRIAHVDGSWRTVELRARAHFDTPGIHGLIVNGRDVTHRRQTEQALHDRIRTAQLTRELARALAGDAASGEALQECAAVLSAHFSAALVAFWTWEPEQESLMLGAASGRDWLCRDLPVRVGLDAGVIGRVAREQRPVLHLGEARNAAGRDVFAAEGEALPASIVAALTFPLIADGRLAGVLRLLSFQAVSVQTVEAVSAATNWIAAGIERARAEQRLAIERAYFATLFNAAPIAIVVHDELARVQLVNEEFERLFGYPAHEVVGRDLNDLIVAPQDRADGDDLTRKAQVGRVAQECCRLRKDRTPVHVALVGCPVEIPGSRPVIFAMYLDIGERRRAEQEQERLGEQLRQAQKMEAIGRLAGGIAHDFNNLLTVIVGHTQMLLEHTDAATPAWAELDEVRQATERASSLTRQLLAFSRRQILQPVPLDLNHVVLDMERMLRRLIRAEIELATHLESGLWTVQADPGQMEQVLLNLVVNARDAMPNGGRLEIRTENRRIEAHHPAAVANGLAGGDYTVLGVRDEGVGIDAETLSQVFEPFYTTKEPGKGTGLGLATAYGIVRQSGGTITVESAPGEGTTFHVLLPRSHAPAATAAEPVAAAASIHVRGGAVVLVAEDEAGVRRVVSTVLRKHGFDVVEATDGAAAIEAARQRGAPVDLLVTDVVMPGINGRQLAETLRTLWPALPVLFISGYTEDEVIRGGVRQAGTDFLEKPFRPVVLLQRVARLLDGGVPAGGATG